MAKTLFNSSDKSNFILNMSEEKYSKLASIGLLTACFCTSLFTMIPEIFREADSATKVSYEVVAGGLAISGVICLILALISLIRKFSGKHSLFPVCAFGAVVLLAAVSLIFSYDYNVGIYGFPKRGEGFLAILYYFGFFVTGISIKNEKALKTLSAGIIGAGVLNSLWSLIQVFTGKLTFYTARDAHYVGFKANPASGLSQSPIFLAMVLSLTLTVALAAAILTGSKKNRILCIVCSALFAFVMPLTYCIQGFVGLGAAIISAAVIVFIKKAPKVRLAVILSAVIPAALAITLAATGVIGDEDSYKLRDGYILWSMDSFQRVQGSGRCDGSVVDISDVSAVYSRLNDKTLKLIKKYPMTGTGPEQLVYPQLYTMGVGVNSYNELSEIIPNNDGTFDKVYNEYLYTAATRGIPSLIALAALLIWVIASGRKRLKNAPAESTVLYFAALTGILIFFVGCSNITFSPIFWAAAGASGAAVKPVKTKAEKRKRKK